MTIQIPNEAVSQTKYWNTYDNSDFKFSFKYPEGEISDLKEVKFGKTTEILSKEVRDSSMKSSTQTGYDYNVKFGVDAWKTRIGLDKFLEKNLPETKNLKKEKVTFENLDGVRINNTEEKAEVYFAYYIFMVDEFAYNFALFSDDPVLVDANIPLLEKIISTAKFY